MKILTEENLFDFLDENISWRKKEIVYYHTSIVRANKSVNSVLLRGAIPLMYAHWEGFIKESANAYWRYVTNRRLIYRKLPRTFVSKYIYERILKNNTAIDINHCIEISDFFLDGLDQISDFKFIKEPISTKSNLNSKVLKEIVLILGLKYDSFEGYEQAIDKKLLDLRNGIAHGENRSLDYSTYLEIYNLVIYLIEQFKTEIQNAVAIKSYTSTSANSSSNDCLVLK